MNTMYICNKNERAPGFEKNSYEPGKSIARKNDYNT